MAAKWAKQIVAAVLISALLLPAGAAAQVKVAVLPSWGDVPAFTELNNNWSAYGSEPVSIDTSLLYAGNVTYEGLVNTGADVLWLSGPAGGTVQYTAGEMQAIRDYCNAGHGILGTYLVFQAYGVDNRPLAPIFGLSELLNYDIYTAGQAFTWSAHQIFTNLANPYVSTAYYRAQVPADDFAWDAADLGSAEVLAITGDARGVITLYDAGPYRAVFVSEMVEFLGGAADTQFLYNVLTYLGAAPVLEAIEIAGPNELPDNNSAQYQATAWYESGPSADVTAQAAWQLNAGSPATIDSAGVLTTDELDDFEKTITISATYSQADVTLTEQIQVVIWADCTVAELVERNINGAAELKADVLANLAAAMEKERRARAMLGDYADDESLADLGRSLKRISRDIKSALRKEQRGSKLIDKSLTDLTDAKLTLTEDQ